MDHSPGHPGIAAVSLIAASLGVMAGAIEGSHSHVFSAFTPDDLTAWTKAVLGTIFASVNTLVGCANLIAIARGRRRKPRPTKETPSESSA